MHYPKRILVGVDFSAPSLAAFDYGLRLLERAGSSLVVVHVLPTRLRATRPAVLDRLRAVAADLGLAPSHLARLMVCTGEPLDLLCSAAVEANSNLLLVGRSGLGGARDVGHITRRLVEQAPCAVVPIQPDARGVLPHVTGCPA
jgi:nucleotide-binding universal stress UspA family protein